MTLDQAGQPAYDWLARDLLPGLLAFIAQASDATYSLRAADLRARPGPSPARGVPGRRTWPAPT